MARNPDSTAEDIAERETDLMMDGVEADWRAGTWDEDCADKLIGGDDGLDGDECAEVLMLVYLHPDRLPYISPSNLGPKDDARRIVARAVREVVDAHARLYAERKLFASHRTWKHLAEFRERFLAEELERRLEPPVPCPETVEEEAPDGRHGR